MNTIRVPFELYKQVLLSKNAKEIDFDDFIFSDFILNIEGFKNILFPIEYQVSWFSKEKSIIFSSLSNFYTGKFKPSLYKWEPLENIIDHGKLSKPYGSFESNAEKENALNTASMILFYMDYIMNYPREHTEKEVMSYIKHKFSREHRISTNQNKIYLLDDIIKYVHKDYVPKGGHHNIQCPCWEVRGHYRHYKSGKIVKINSFRKGKQRQVAEPMSKEYYI